MNTTKTVSKKRVVHYLTDHWNAITIGYPAFVWPIDHTSPLVSNTKLVETSMVLSHNKESGRFETENSIYLPYQPENDFDEFEEVLA